jgi:hypothetical protein
MNNTKVSRRTAIRAGAFGVTGMLAAGARPVLGTAVNRDAAIVGGAYVLDARTISLYSPQTGEISGGALWGISSAFQKAASLLALPLSMSLVELEAWVDGHCGDSCAASLAPSIVTPGTAFEAAMQVPISGVPNMSDLIGSAVVAIADGAPLDMSLQFLYASSLELTHSVALPIIQVGLGGSPGAPAAPYPIPAGNPPPPSITLFGWKLQFRGPETHSLSNCVTVPVNHFHVEIQRQTRPGKWDYILNLHLGTYRSSGRRCFVMWNNYEPRFCWKTCGPTWDELRRMMLVALTAAAAIAGVALAAWVAALIAGSAATALFPAMLLL